MNNYNDREPVTPSEEIQFYLDNAASVTEEPDPQAAAEEKRLADIAEQNTRSHSDALTVIIIAFVMLFFGAVFTALTDHQDFSEGEEVTFARIVGGGFFSDIEKKFNDSLPLRDQFHNASSAIKFCFGIGNTTDFIDIEAKHAADDPYSVSDTEQYIPSANTDSGEDGGDDDENRQKTLPSLVTTSNNKNRKIKGITLTTVRGQEDQLTESYDPISVNRDPPAGNHIPGFSPYGVTSSEEVTAPPETQSGQDTGSSSSPDYFTNTNPIITRPSESEASQPDVSDSRGSESQPAESGDSSPETAPQPSTPKVTSDPFVIPAWR